MPLKLKNIALHIHTQQPHAMFCFANQLKVKKEILLFWRQLYSGLVVVVKL